MASSIIGPSCSTFAHAERGTERINSWYAGASYRRGVCHVGPGQLILTSYVYQPREVKTLSLPTNNDYIFPRPDAERNNPLCKRCPRTGASVTTPTPPMYTFEPPNPSQLRNIESTSWLRKRLPPNPESRLEGQRRKSEIIGEGKVWHLCFECR